jgi:hypothetical protein
MRSPKGGKNKLTHNSPVKKVLKGQGAAKPKIQKKEIKTKTIVEYLLRSLDYALPKKPRLPLNPRQKKEQKEMLKVMRSIKNLELQD